MPGSSSTIRMRAPAVLMSWIGSMAATLFAVRDVAISRLKSRVRQDGVGDERVGPSLLAEARHRSVPRHETHVVAQRPELGGDGVDQVGVVAAWKVGASDGALEQHVAHLGEARLAMEEDHVAGRV